MTMVFNFLIFNENEYMFVLANMATIYLIAYNRIDNFRRHLWI